MSIFDTTDQTFVCCDGTPIDSLKNLALKLDTMNLDVFNFHVTEDRNDFAKWVYDVYGQEELAENIGRLKDQKDMNYELMIFLIKNM